MNINLNDSPSAVFDLLDGERATVDGKEVILRDALYVHKVLFETADSRVEEYHKARSMVEAGSDPVLYSDYIKHVRVSLAGKVPNRALATRQEFFEAFTTGEYEIG